MDMDHFLQPTIIMEQKENSTNKVNQNILVTDNFASNLSKLSDIQSITSTSLEPLVQFEDICHQAPTNNSHYNSHRAPWLRALILGANDGLVSIASLMMGIGAISKTYDGRAMVLSGLAGLVAGTCSMAIGEFVSVFFQRDIELADLEKKRKKHMFKRPLAQAQELEELTQLYVGRGLNYFLAKQVAEEMSKVDVLKAHARDKLGIDMDALANPLQAATASAIAFALGGAIPLLSGSFIANFTIRLVVIVIASTLAFLGFGAFGAQLGGAAIAPAAIRVLIGGWLAMLITYGMLKLVKVAGISS